MFQFILLLLAMAALPAAASADVTARYRGGGSTALIEVDDNGNARLGGEGGASYSLFVAAGDFIVFEEDGAFVAGRYDDFQALLAGLGAPLIGPPPEPAESPLRPAGRERIAGYDGTRFEWRQPGARNGHAILSDSPELRPLGRAMAKLLTRMPSFQEVMTGQRPAALRALARMLDSAALLRLDGEFELEAVAFDPIRADRFVLPVKVLTREQLAARLNLPPEAGSHPRD
jgi:hypothetical protein